MKPPVSSSLSPSPSSRPLSLLLPQLLLCLLLTTDPVRHVSASPISPIARRQAVTAAISPPSPPPPGCTGSFPTVFGIAVVNITLPSTSPSLSLTSTPSPSAPLTNSEVTTTPVPSVALAPADEMLGMGKRQIPAPLFTVVTVGNVNQINDGQVQGGMHTVPVTLITPTITSSPLSTLNVGTAMTTLPPVSQIGDGQIQAQGPQAATASVTVNPTGVACLDSEIEADGPLPLPSGAALGSSDAGVGATSATASNLATTKPPTVLEQACGISTRLQDPPVPSSPPPSPTSTLTPAAAAAAVPPEQATASQEAFSFSVPVSVAKSSPAPSPIPPPRLSLVSCLTNSTLRLTLSSSILYDALDRTGYIASNFQFQFDSPPQAGALWTAGWSVCPSPSGGGIADGEGQAGAMSDQVEGDGDDGNADGLFSLALGGSTTFWQCLSGDFYNLYTENWAAQCSPVELRVTRLVEC